MGMSPTTRVVALVTAIIVIACVVWALAVN